MVYEVPIVIVSGHSSSQEHFDPMVFEKEFPLIQAHAAEQFGG